MMKHLQVGKCKGNGNGKAKTKSDSMLMMLYPVALSHSRLQLVVAK